MTFDEHGEAIDRLNEWGMASLNAARLQAAFGVAWYWFTDDFFMSLLALVLCWPAFVLNDVLDKKARLHLEAMKREVGVLRKRAGE